MITVQRISDSAGFIIAVNILIDKHESINAFKEMVQRAANLWPDATPEIKEFADLITEGRILQDYRSQDTSSSGKERKKEYRIARIVKHPHNSDMTVMCSCGIGQSLAQECIAYQCSNCKTDHIIRNYVK